jgi:hypothetical protein
MVINPMSNQDQSASERKTSYIMAPELSNAFGEKWGKGGFEIREILVRGK